MVNCHIHTFLLSDVPEKFLPAHLVKIMKNKIGYFLINKALRDIIPFTSSDAIEKYANFLLIGESDTQKDVFYDCQKFYPIDTKFVVLSMDMAYMKAGKVTRTFKEQIIELGKLSKEDGVILPFIHLDPRNPDMMDLLKMSKEEYDFKGIKLYPNVGYLPFDKRL